VKKNPGGRPKVLLENIEFDGWQMLDELIVFGSEVYCADKLRMNVDTLAARIKEKYGLSFSEYKDKKRESVKFDLLKKQYEVAMTGSVPMLIWLGKQYLDQNDNEKPITEKAIKVVIEDYKNGNKDSTSA